MQSKRIATALVTTTALAATLSAVPTAAAAEPTPPTGQKSVKVDGGIVKISLDAMLLEILKLKGLVLTQLTPECQVPKAADGKPYLPSVTQFTLGITQGSTTGEANKVGGKLDFSGTCLGLTNIKKKTAVVLKDLKTDLSAGSISATLASEKGVLGEVKLGTYKPPALDAEHVDHMSNTIEFASPVTVDASLAAKLNSELGADVISGGPLFNLQSVISLENGVDVAAALGLKLNAGATTGGLVDGLSKTLGGLLGRR
ncbi:hypothetical protein [Streptomyces sp. NBC_01304]|uniref:hypothetical protein n=1 Tax=Streptomyces sp. NBC_01304 TaxID=2903818 RepID=UPI002E15C4D8|nr:hypothetical protein OG430_04735 [Streptomyces sp. NBC_01304]